MGVWAIQIQGGGGGRAIWGSRRRRIYMCSPATISIGSREVDVGLLKVSSWRTRSWALTARPKKSGDGRSSSDGNNDRSNAEGNDEDATNSSADKAKSNDATEKSSYTLHDWRDFRADLVSREHVLLIDSSSSEENISAHERKSWLGEKWAHPIPMPEAGCVLVATEKLDGVRSFERSVVLLLRLGTRDPREGPFGVIINRPLNKKIKQMKPRNYGLETTFADCCLHYGGPLDASMFLLNSDEKRLAQGFEKVVPGVFYGVKHSLDAASELVKKGVVGPQDFRFFVGYAGWQLDQLMEEIESDYWVVAACSSHLISGASSDSSNLWKEILQLMGGQYLELSRKPKQDNF